MDDEYPLAPPWIKEILKENPLVEAGRRIMDDVYRNIDCPNCGRHCVQSDGVCEKCLWDVDGGNYASITRPVEYDYQRYI